MNVSKPSVEANHSLGQQEPIIVSEEAEALIQQTRADMPPSEIPKAAPPDPSMDAGPNGAGVTGPTSAAQVEANRRNAERSTGPRSTEGKRRSSLNAMQHGGYGRPQAIPRGILIESEKEVQDYVDAIVAALAPRDAPELVIARRIATSDLRLARLERYESVALAQVSRVRSDLGEATNLEVEMTMEFATAAHVAALCLIPENRLVVEVETWTTITTVIWRMHKVPPSEHLEPDISYDDDAAPALWRRFIVEILIPKYWDSSEAAYAALEAESQRWADLYRELASDNRQAPHGGAWFQAQGLRNGPWSYDCPICGESHRTVYGPQDVGKLIAPPLQLPLALLPRRHRLRG
jgi:hypothetical protein